MLNLISQSSNANVSVAKTMDGLMVFSRRQYAPDTGELGDPQIIGTFPFAQVQAEIDRRTAELAALEAFQSEWSP